MMYIVILIIGLVVSFTLVRHEKIQDKKWYPQFALSKEDAAGQLFILLAFFFLGITLLAFNRDLGAPLSWRAIFFITSSAGVVSAYYFKTFYTLLFGLIGLTTWWGAQSVQWISGKNIKMSVIFVGLSFLALLFYLLGHLHKKQMKFKRFASVYLVLGIINITGLLFFFSTKIGIRAIGEMTRGSSLFGSWQLTLSLCVFFILLIGITLYAAARKVIFLFELLAVLVLTCLFGVVVFIPEQIMFINQIGHSYPYYGSGELSSAGVLWAIICNFAIFFELLWLIFSGYLRRETWLINLGTLFMFLLIIVKYFDWFFTFLDKSIFFIGAGILLFVVGLFMEKSRRHMILNIKA